MKAFTLLTSLLLCLAAAAQRPPRSYFPTYAHSEWYAQQAAERLPQLYKTGQYDSILQYINTIDKATNYPYIFATRLLVKMQLGIFDANVINGPWFLDSLQSYAYAVRRSQSTTPEISNQPGARLEDMPYEDRLYLFNTNWAKLLPQTKTIDSLQALLCSIIAGNIENPEQAIRNKRHVYPGLDSLIKKREVNLRNHSTGNLAWGVGLWAPQGNAVILGVHPAINLALGWRNKLNEVNLGLSMRFGRTPQDYQILRQDSLYSRHYYTGGYIGMEYTRYLYHSLHFEAGVTGGLGVDFIDFANDNSNHNNDYLKPLEKTSLNLNGGLRVNYFFNSRGYIGLEGKFNNIHYHNTGGSPLDGNAYTLTLLLGHN